MNSIIVSVISSSIRWDQISTSHRLVSAPSTTDTNHWKNNCIVSAFRYQKSLWFCLLSHVTSVILSIFIFGTLQEDQFCGLNVKLSGTLYGAGLQNHTFISRDWLQNLCLITSLLFVGRFMYAFISALFCLFNVQSSIIYHAIIIPKTIVRWHQDCWWEGFTLPIPIHHSSYTQTNINLLLITSFHIQIYLLSIFFSVYKKLQCQTRTQGNFHLSIDFIPNKGFKGYFVHLTSLFIFISL